MDNTTWDDFVTTVDEISKYQKKVTKEKKQYMSPVENKRTRHLIQNVLAQVALKAPLLALVR